MKRLFGLLLFAFFAIGCYAGDKVRGNLRTEINGFKWYCYKNKEAYSVDCKKLFTNLKKVESISFSAADKNDKGVFIIHYKDGKHKKVGAFKPTEEIIFSSDIDKKLQVNMLRTSLSFYNPHRKEYYIKISYNDMRVNRQFVEFRYDNGNKIVEYYGYDYKFNIMGNFIINEKPYNHKAKEVIRYDGIKITGDYEEIIFQKDAKHVLCKNTISGTERINHDIAIIDSLGKILVSSATNVTYNNGVCIITNKKGCGLLSYAGKWIVTPEKGYDNYSSFKVNNRAYYCLQYKGSSRYNLINEDGTDIFGGKEFDAIERIGGNYIRVKDSDKYGIMTLDGRVIIPTSRNYTSIGNFNSKNRTFSFTRKGFSGELDEKGQEISTVRFALTVDEIKTDGDYSYAAEILDGSTKYFKVCKGGHYGLTDAYGKVIIPTEMDDLESAGTGYLKYKINGYWGLMNYQGMILIDTSRGYTYISDYISFTKRFAFTMFGYKGECDDTGQEISKIESEESKQNTSVVSSNSSSSTTSNSSLNSDSSNSNNSENNTTKIVVEHHHTPTPVQVWNQCVCCYGSGKCQICGGLGYTRTWNGILICEFGCGGSGKCSFCAGQGGHYEVEYR